MIFYEANKNWLKDLTHLYRSWTMQKVCRSTLWTGFITAIICFLVIDVFGLREEMEIEGGVFSLLGIVLSILLSFRTSTAYDRWWEGRKNWGDLVNNSRNLAVLVNATFTPDNKLGREKMANLISNFAIALKDHLRDGAKTSDLINLTDDQLIDYNTSTHIPNRIAMEIQQLIQDAYRKKEISPEDLLNMKIHSQSFIDVLGACERIKKTPIPFSYNVYLKIFITAYSLILPFGMIHSYGYWAILFTMFVFFAFIGVELMAEEIEDPFGLDCNDLPTATIAHTIKSNVFEILEHKHLNKEKIETELYQKIF